jgi:SAM-dependent methyltransferase
MKAIYLQDERSYGWRDRVFLEYALHRAVYHRLQILDGVIEAELRRRLATLARGENLRILTAPSGYAFDLLRPLARLSPEQRGRIHVMASDLDPEGGIEPELRRAFETLEVGFDFARGDLTSHTVRERFCCSGPFDLVLFVGLSSWIAKPHLVNHLRLIRAQLLAPGGVLITDTFTPHAYAVSGKYAGFRASYYAPREFTHVLACIGFDPAGISWQSGAQGINHVCLARLGPMTPPLGGARVGAAGTTAAARSLPLQVLRQVQ